MIIEVVVFKLFCGEKGLRGVLASPALNSGSVLGVGSSMFVHTAVLKRLHDLCFISTV